MAGILMKKFFEKLILTVILLATLSMVMGGCVINLCGTVLTFCTPIDQLNLMFPLLQVPDYDSDPSCSIPLGCGSSDVLPPLIGGPGGGPPNEPTDNQGGGMGGGGGGI